MSTKATTCEAFWLKCPRSPRRVLMFENLAGNTVRLRLCDEHGEQFQDPAFRARMLEKAMGSLEALRRAGTVMDPNDLLGQPVQIALSQHQLECDRCARVRDWVASEQQGGRIRDEADLERVGHYVLDHCCPRGVMLNEAVGRVMRGVT